MRLPNNESGEKKAKTTTVQTVGLSAVTESGRSGAAASGSRHRNVDPNKHGRHHNVDPNKHGKRA